MRIGDCGVCLVAVTLSLTLLVLPVADSFGFGAPVVPLASTHGEKTCAWRPMGLPSPRGSKVAAFEERSSSLTMMAKNLPKNIKDTVSQLRDALQQGLGSRCSRMVVEMPYAANFGVEGAKTAEEGAIPNKIEDSIRSDRELARLIAGLFEGTELESSTVAAFSDQQLATKATKKWGSSYRGKVIVVDAKQKKVKSSSGGGFGAKASSAAQPSSSAVPEGTEVLLIVAPGRKQLKAVETIAREVGMGCLIVLVNARLSELTYDSDAQKQFFASEFQSVYHLQPNPVPTWSGGVLFRSFPDDWTLAIPRKIGPPRVLATSKEKWGVEEMEKVLRDAQAGEGDILSDVGNAIGGAFGGLFGGK